jgi:hypothetical protein
MHWRLQQRTGPFSTGQVRCVEVGVHGGRRRGRCFLVLFAGLAAAALAFAGGALAAGPTNGQLWFPVGGAPAETGVGHVNSDASNPGLVGLHDEGSSSIGLDLPAGYYFAVSTDHLFLESHRVSDATKVDEIQIVDANGAGSLDDELMYAIAVDPINEIVYVGRWGNTKALSRIVKVSYNPSTGDLNNNGAYNSGSQQELINGTQAGSYTNGRYFDLDDHYLYYSDTDNGYNTAPFVPTNGVFRVDLNNPAGGATQLSSQAQFPTNYSNGYIAAVAADSAKGLVYFTTHGATNAATLWYMPIAGGTATAVGLPAGTVLSIGDTPTAGLTLDPQSQHLYVTVQSNHNQGFHEDAIRQGVLSADGHSITSWINVDQLSTLVGHVPDPNAHVAGTAFDLLPVLAGLTGTSTHPVEQAVSPTMLLIGDPAVTDADNDHLAGATVRISNSFVGSGDSLSVAGQTSGTVAGTSIAVSTSTDAGGNQTLALTGYDTFPHYQQVLGDVGFRANGDNPTNYGANTTRTLTWKVSDGAPGIADGAQNSGTTSVTIDAVNDAPTAAITPVTYAATEQVSLSLKNTGLSVADVDGLSGTVTLSVGEGTLNVTAGGSGATVLNSGTSSVTLTGTLAQINALLSTNATSAVSYIDNTDTPSANTTLTLQISDNGNTGSGGALTGSDTAQITITAVNDAPLAAITPVSYSATEQVSLSLKNTGLSVSDVDALGASETATLSVGEGTLNMTAGGSGAAVSNSGTSSVTINGTLAQINALLNTDGSSTVSYVDNTDTPSASTTLTLQINDNGNTGTGGPLTGSDTAQVNITAVNDAPTATITPASYTATEQVSLSLKNNGLAVSDPDGLAGSETVTLSVGEGTLNVTAGGSGAGVSGSGTGSVTLTGTVAQLNALLNTNGTSTVGYVDNTDTPSAGTTLTLQINDGGNTGTGGALTGSDTAQVNITAVDDPPVNTVPAAQTVAEGSDLPIPSLHVSDADVGANDLTVIFGVLHGKVTVATNVPGGVGPGDVSNNGTASVTLIGTPAELNTTFVAANSVVYKSGLYQGAETLTMTSNDQGHTGTGGPLTDVDTVGITVTAPTIAYAQAAGNCGAGNDPCFNSVQAAIDAVGTGGTVSVLGGSFGESVNLNKNATVNVNGATMINDVTIGAGTLGGGSATLTVSGNWTHAAGTFTPGTGTVVFDKSGTASLSLPAQAGGTETFCNVTVSSGTTLDTGDDFAALAGGGCGTLANNGQIRHAQTASVGTSPVSFKDGLNHAALDVSGAPTGLGSTAVTVAAGGSYPASFDACGTLPLSLVSRFWRAVPTTTDTVTLRFWFRDAERNALNPADLKLWKCTGAGGWTQVGSNYQSSVAPDASGYHFFQADAVTVGSSFVLAQFAPTAVRVASFRAAAARPAGVKLTWRTASEAGLLGFNVWRNAATTKRWTKVNSRLLPAKSRRIGGASYTFRDLKAAAGRTYSYRLEIVALGGDRRAVAVASVRTSRRK